MAHRPLIGGKSLHACAVAVIALVTVVELRSPRFLSLGAAGALLGEAVCEPTGGQKLTFISICSFVCLRHILD